MNTQVQPAGESLVRGGLATTEASIAAMESAMHGYERRTLADMLQEQDKLMGQAKEVSQLQNTADRAARLEIINASMESLSKKIEEYREDTAELIAGLEAEFEKLGIELSELQKSTQEDLQLVKTTEDYLLTLRTEGATTRQRLVDAKTEAGNAWIGKDSKVADAQLEIDRFDAQHATDIASAETAIVEAKEEVERQRRKRIREADFDSQFQRFISLASQIQTKLLDNVKNSEGAMVKTQAELTSALTQRASLADELAKLEQEVVAAENIVMATEQELNGATDQASRSTIEMRLGTERQKLGELTGKRTEMQTAFNSYEAAATKHSTMLDTIRIQTENQRAHARKLQIDSKARFVQAQNIVTIIKNTAQEDAASRLHRAGSALDRTSMETSARALVASERERLAIRKGHEDAMRQFAEITGALAEGRANIAIEDAEISARMQKNYGVDPLQSSWLYVAENLSKGDEAKAA